MNLKTSDSSWNYSKDSSEVLLTTYVMSNNPVLMSCRGFQSSFSHIELFSQYGHILNPTYYVFITTCLKKKNLNRIYFSIYIHPNVHR